MKSAPWRIGVDIGGTFTDLVNGKPVAAKARIVLQPGDVITYETPGGGGMGPVAERDPAAIARDIKEGYVTP